MTFIIPQLFLGLMFKRLTFSEKLLFVLAVPLRLFFEVVGLLAAVRWGDGVLGVNRKDWQICKNAGFDTSINVRFFVGCCMK